MSVHRYLCLKMFALGLTIFKLLKTHTEGMKCVTVADKGAGRCMDPEGNEVNPGKGSGGGPPSPPSGEQDKQLISSRGGGNTLMEQPGRLEDESGVSTGPMLHRVRNTVNNRYSVCK